MQHRKLGKSDLTVSVVGLGCNNFGGRMEFAATQRVVDRALDIGITLFDTADAYGDPNKGGSEEALGAILGERRKRIVLATKFGLPMADDAPRDRGSRRYIMQALEASLKRLRTDWIDLYQYHRPDGVTPFEETLRALDDLVREGKVRAIGCSNMTAAQIDEAQACARANGLTAFVSTQEQYSVLVRGIEQDLLPAAERHGLALLPYFPLASGLLTGKYRRGTPAPEGSRLAYSQRHMSRFGNARYLDAVEELDTFCKARGRTLLELAFGWLLARPSIPSVIAGATRPEQLDQNVAAAGWALSPEELAEVNRITANLPPPAGPA
jgi:aryl-alcohol dehydrogenase-like predicted oxidoreductase